MNPIHRKLTGTVGVLGTLVTGWFMSAMLTLSTLGLRWLPPAERRQEFLERLFTKEFLIGYLPLTASLFLCVKAVVNPSYFLRRSDLHLLIASILAAVLTGLLVMLFVVGFW